LGSARIAYDREEEMIEILDSPKHLVALKLSGALSADDVTKAYNATDEALKENERISFFGEIDESMNLTFEGLAKDLVTGLGQFGKLSKYHRAAVVTDKGWIGALARVEGLVFSSIDVRVFALDERDKAFAWASEVPAPLPKPEEPKPSLHFIQTTTDNVFAYEVNGRLREKDIKNAVDALKPYLGREGKINVLARLRDFNGFDLTALFDDDLAKLKYKALSKVERYAVVGAKPWMRNFLELLSPLFSAKIRVFDASDEAAAWEWVGAQQALLVEKSA
jgi:SpoIIAA-like